VIADPSVDVLSAANSLKAHREGYGIAVGGGHGSYESWEPAPEGVDVKVVSEGGADVKDLGPFTVAGKATIMDFSAKWCEPCRMLDAHILELMETRSDVAYRKLEVLDWDSPLAVHYMKDVGQLPYVIIFDKSGRSVAEVSGFDTERIDAAIEVARRSQ
jgi:thiol-disulfide isomerase/thioredoxin